MASQQPFFSHSQVPLNPTFRNAAVSTVAVVPLLSHDPQTGELLEDTHSLKSHAHLMDALRRHQTCASPSAGSSGGGDDNGELLLVVPNSALTRPGDWRYNETPLKAFHWQQGCQRLLVHDGRPEQSRHAHERLIGISKDWNDLLPHRRTAAVVGVLNMHDCRSLEDLHRAEESLHEWAVRFASPPYEVTAHGRNFERDHPIQRLFVYDSFDEESQRRVDLNKSRTSILAFPPSDEAHAQMMDLHMNIVISDLTVAIFQQLEDKIRDSNEVTAKEMAIQESKSNRRASGVTATAGVARSTLSRYISSGSSDNMPSNEEEPLHQSSRNLGIGQLAGLVSPDSKLAKESTSAATSASRSSSFGSTDNATPPTSTTTTATTPPSTISGKARSDSVESAATTSTTATSASMSTRHKLPKMPLLLTPLDSTGDVLRDLPAKDAEAVRRREVGRREKYVGDLCLLAGSPLDAYERYLKAAELCKTGPVDPLWHASALEGCAAAHIAMAEAGGYGYV